jgi:hypothetical protein
MTRFSEELRVSLVKNTHSSKLTGNMPFANKVRKNFLIEAWRARW